MDADPQTIKAWGEATKAAIDLMKTAASLLPKGDKKALIEAKVQEAERELARADAKLAQQLGYRHCFCKFPPPLMLWREKEAAFVCENPDCGHRHEWGSTPKGPLAPKIGTIA